MRTRLILRQGRRELVEVKFFGSYDSGSCSVSSVDQSLKKDIERVLKEPRLVYTPNGVVGEDRAYPELYLWVLGTLQAEVNSPNSGFTDLLVLDPPEMPVVKGDPGVIY